MFRNISAVFAVVAFDDDNLLFLNATHRRFCLCHIITSLANKVQYDK